MSGDKYRKGVGIVLINNAGLVFIAERCDIKGSWQMPQGGIDEGELPRESALRELEEETCISSAHLIGQETSWFKYDVPKEACERFWGGKYVGQTQQWFAARFDGSDEEINLEATNPREFERYMWATPEQAIDMVVKFKKDMYVKIFQHFKKQNLL